MNSVAYYLLLALFKCLGWLPMCLLYLLSDILYVVLYHIVWYRRQVVRDNLLRVFPDKTPAERTAIAKGFYHALCDVIVEMLKMFSASAEEMHRRIRFAHPEIWNGLYVKGKMVMIVMSHYGNWEWLASTTHTTMYPFVTLYHVLHNPVFERLMRHLRTRFGTGVVSMKSFYRKLLSCMQAQQPTAFGFVADQAPKHQTDRQWTRFLNQDTQVYGGVEKMARKYDFAVIYLSVRRIRRGYYIVEDTLVTDGGASTAPGEITDRTMRLLEEDIYRAPQYWLWSHKRWKHVKTPDTT